MLHTNLTRYLNINCRSFDSWSPSSCCLKNIFAVKLVINLLHLHTWLLLFCALQVFSAVQDLAFQTGEKNKYVICIYVIAENLIMR